MQKRRKQVPAREILSVDIEGESVKARNHLGQVDTAPLGGLTRREYVRAAAIVFPGIPLRAWQGNQSPVILKALRTRTIPESVKFKAENILKRELPDGMPPRIMPDTVNVSGAAIVNVPPKREIKIKRRPKNEHRDFERVYRILARGLGDSYTDAMNVYLVGPAGTGKSTLAEQIAKSLKVPFGAISLSPLPIGSKIFGFTDAGGNTVRTSFRECFEHGGLFLFDEMDAGHPGDLAAVNQALANGICAFPDAIIRAHANFRCIAAANTIGHGSDKDYNGRNKLDAATLDRFVMVKLDIDESLEMALALAQVSDESLHPTITAFVKRVQLYRSRVNGAIVISPRASIDGAKLIDAGFTIEEIEEMRIWKGCAVSVRERAKSAASIS